jgi:vancomycin resistance protein YoaR
MFDDETVVQDTINPAENDTPENDGQETVEDPPEDASTEGETTENEEPDYYEAQLRELQEENERLKEEAEERERQIAVKDRAILAQRSKLRQAAQPSSVDAEKLKADIKHDLQVDAQVLLDVRHQDGEGAAVQPVQATARLAGVGYAHRRNHSTPRTVAP